MVVAKILNEYPKSSLRIIGHTDSVGSAESNLTLSERRAESVGNYLIRQNVKSGRLMDVRLWGTSSDSNERYSAAGRAATVV